MSQLFPSGGQSIWSFSFSMRPSNEYSGLISFRMVWFGLLAVQGTLRGLLQHHSSKASVLWSSAFFMVQLSHPYVTTGKAIALTIWNFVSKVMSLLFNPLSRFVIAFHPRSKRHAGDSYMQWTLKSPGWHLGPHLGPSHFLFLFSSCLPALLHLGPR